MSSNHRLEGGDSNQSTRQLAIKGWTNSKLSSSQDQGLEALLSFLSKKASRPILSHTRAGRTVLIITVNHEDQDRFFHLNGFTFAGAILTVEEARSPNSRSQNQQTTNQSRHPQSQSQTFSQNNARGQSQNNYSQSNAHGHLDNQFSQHNARRQPPSNSSQNNARGQPHVNPNQGNIPRGPSQGNSRGPNQDNLPPRGPRGQFPDRAADSVTSALETVIIHVIRERYHAADKHLILNALVTDAAITSSGLSSQDPAKVWKAIFTLCERNVWETPSKRRENVQSVSLRDDNITSVKDILSLSSVFPSIKNLDLANNNLVDLDALKFWKNQFREMEHLILSGNPVSTSPDTLPTLLKWYPNLKLYNGEPIRDSAGNPLIPTNNTIQPAPTNLDPMAINNPPLVPNNPQIITPLTTSLPLQTPAASHPEFPPGSTFGLPEPSKPQEVLQREQMGLQFSFETRLKMEWVENCLSANNWDYTAAMANFNALRAQGTIPPEAYITGV